MSSVTPARGDKAETRSNAHQSTSKSVLHVDQGTSQSLQLAAGLAALGQLGLQAT